MTSAELTHIASELDALFAESPAAGYRTPRAPEIPRLASRYAEIVWTAAAQLPPLDVPGGSEPLAARPVFIVGLPRSGTSLLLNLLDSHPALGVLPTEGDLLTRFAPRLRRLDQSQQLRFLGKIWIARLIHGVNLPPYWLLGPPDTEPNPYLTFTRRIRSWGMSDGLQAYRRPYPAFLAVVLAWLESRHGTLEFAHWVEKTPGHEIHLRRSLRIFPEAKCIHVVRDPRAVLFSRIAIEANTGGRTNEVRRLAIDIGRSLRLAQRFAAQLGNMRYLVIRYEDLATDTEAVMQSVAQFLDIGFDRSLLQPTIAGRPTASNSSHAGSARAGVIDSPSAPPRFDAATCKLLARHGGRAAAGFGYDVGD